ncbi:hypothetical protein JFY74_17470 [Pectobacterium carotovorum]|nr:hypothetical protein JFY74_17470 [Pectobacterium carotovorum]
MALQRTMVYKELVSENFQIDENSMATEVRKLLVEKNYIGGSDTDKEAWRFFIYSTTDTDNYSDSILAKNTESLVPIKMLLGPGQQLYLTNINKGHHPDLMGIGVNWFFDRNMGCKISLNNEDESAKQKNADKFQPMMMKHVHPTSQNVVGIYDNVVVCEKGSVIKINISSWGAAGFAYSIKPDKGDNIVDTLYLVLGDSPDSTAQVSMRRYQSKANQIVIDSTSSMNIPSGQSVDYQRISIKTWPVTSYKKNGKTYSSHSQPPSVTMLEESSSLVNFMAKANVQFSNVSDRQLASAEILPGDSLEPGTARQGDPSSQQFGTISNISDNPGGAIGEVVIYFFVFKSHDDAVKVIDQINAPNPKVWN